MGETYTNQIQLELTGENEYLLFGKKKGKVMERFRFIVDEYKQYIQLFEIR